MIPFRNIRGNISNNLKNSFNFNFRFVIVSIESINIPICVKYPIVWSKSKQQLSLSLYIISIYFSR